jgi:hypothetical protein
MLFSVQKLMLFAQALSIVGARASVFCAKMRSCQRKLPWRALHLTAYANREADPGLGGFPTGHFAGRDNLSWIG